MNNQQLFLFNQFEIHFAINDKHLMVNATEMAKPFGKQVNEFLSNKSTDHFILACLKNGNSRFLNLKSRDDLLITKQRNGTWMHRILALKFAAWLDPAFELWVYTTIDDILYRHYKKLEDSLKESAARKAEIKALEIKLSANDEFLKLEQLKADEKKAIYARSKANRDQLDLFEDQLK
ncbi:MAG: KilA-N domain-containing protein [Bacteroidota bacterium]